MNSIDAKKFNTIARQYKAMKKNNPDKHIDFCVQQKTLAEAIEVAAKAIDEHSTIHSHQRRIGKLKLNIFADLLVQKVTEIKRVRDFDELLLTVEAVKSDRIAELTHYDTATRIGAFLNIFPDKIYLHSGTREGAKSLIGNLKERKFLLIDELPKEFQKHDFTASEFEDILCIFKKDFKQSLI